MVASNVEPVPWSILAAFLIASYRREAGLLMDRDRLAVLHPAPLAGFRAIVESAEWDRPHVRPDGLVGLEDGQQVGALPVVEIGDSSAGHQVEPVSPASLSVIRTARSCCHSCAWARTT